MPTSIPVSRSLSRTFLPCKAFLNSEPCADISRLSNVKIRPSSGRPVTRLRRSAATRWPARELTRIILSARGGLRRRQMPLDMILKHSPWPQRERKRRCVKHAWRSPRLLSFVQCDLGVLLERSISTCLPILSPARVCAFAEVILWHVLVSRCSYLSC